MKMNGLFCGGLFWGILISLIGLSIVLKYAFHIEFPFIRVFFGLIIVLFGLKLIIGHTSKPHLTSSEYKRSFHYSNECNIIFSSGTVDLSNPADSHNFPKEISVVFGSAVVLIPDTLNVEVTSTTVFGSTILPDRSYAGFGEDRYIIRGNPEAPIYKIQTNTVFGKLVFDKVRIDNPFSSEQDSTSTKPDITF